MGWVVSVRRITFFLTVAIGAIGLGAAPMALSERERIWPAADRASTKTRAESASPTPAKPRRKGCPQTGPQAWSLPPASLEAPGVATAPNFGGGTPGGPPPGATAMCRDGDYSYSTHHSGTCSGHGGVRPWLNS